MRRATAWAALSAARTPRSLRSGRCMNGLGRRPPIMPRSLTCTQGLTWTASCRRKVLSLQPAVSAGQTPASSQPAGVDRAEQLIHESVAECAVRAPAGGGLAAGLARFDEGISDPGLAAELRRARPRSSACADRRHARALRHKRVPGRRHPGTAFDLKFRMQDLPSRTKCPSEYQWPDLPGPARSAG